MNTSRIDSTIRFVYKLALLEKMRLKRFVLQYYDVEAELRRQDKSIKLDLPDAVCFIEAYGSGK